MVRSTHHLLKEATESIKNAMNFGVMKLKNNIYPYETQVLFQKNLSKHFRFSL